MEDEADNAALVDQLDAVLSGEDLPTTTEEETSNEQTDIQGQEQQEASNAEQEGLLNSQKYKVKTPEGEIEVPLDELLKGYNRQSDYTRKTQELAQERQQLEVQKQNYEQYVQSIPTMSNLIEQNIDKAVSILRSDALIQMAQEDPAGFIREKARLEKYVLDNQQALHQLYIDNAKYQQEAQENSARAQAEALEEGNAALSKQIEGWGTPELDQELQNYVVNHAGFGENDTPGQIYAKRMSVAWKAMQYDKLMQQKPLEAKRVANLPPKAVLGSSKAAESDDFSAAKREAISALRKGNSNKAVDLLADML